MDLTAIQIEEAITLYKLLIMRETLTFKKFNNKNNNVDEVVDIETKIGEVNINIGKIIRNIDNTIKQ
jgi:hypothetical protein